MLDCNGMLCPLWRWSTDHLLLLVLELFWLYWLQVGAGWWTVSQADLFLWLLWTVLMVAINCSYGCYELFSQADLFLWLLWTVLMVAMNCFPRSICSVGWWTVSQADLFLWLLWTVLMVARLLWLQFEVYGWFVLFNFVEFFPFLLSDAEFNLKSTSWYLTLSVSFLPMTGH